MAAVSACGRRPIFRRGTAAVEEELSDSLMLLMTGGTAARLGLLQQKCVLCTSTKKRAATGFPITNAAGKVLCTETLGLLLQITLQASHLVERREHGTSHLAAHRRRRAARLVKSATHPGGGGMISIDGLWSEERKGKAVRPRWSEVSSAVGPSCGAH
jgi:hypothetical protein